MSIDMVAVGELTFRYCRPWWIQMLKLREDIKDEELKGLVKIWNEANPPDES